MAMIFDVLIGSFRELSDRPRPCRTFVNRDEIIKDIKIYLRPDPKNKSVVSLYMVLLGWENQPLLLKRQTRSEKKAITMQPNISM